VLAADAVSLLAAVVLYLFSIGDVKGFALFLGSPRSSNHHHLLFTRPFVVLLGAERTRLGGCGG